LLQKFDPKLGVNEGIGKYSYLSVESTSPKPYTQSTEITIPLTNSNCDVIEFHRSFFTLWLDLYLNVWTPDNYANLFYNGPHGAELGENPVSAPNDEATNITRKLDLFFIGFKNATDCIDSYKIQHNGVDIGTTMQNRAGMESFLFNQMKPQIEKKNKKGSYSLYEDVIRADPGVCGVYLTYQQLIEALTADSHRIHIKFPVTIGFDMLLPLQGFNLFPNSIFGDLSLVIKVNPNALVWCSTEPGLYITRRNHTVYTGVNAGISALCDTAYNNIVPCTPFEMYSKRFTQVRVSGYARGNLYVQESTVVAGTGYGMYDATPLKIDPDVSITSSAVSTIMGFSLRDSVKEAFSLYYATTPFVIASERVFIQSFSTGPSASGLNCAMNIPLNNAKEVIALFPRDANEITCFRNPEYNHLMLTMLNRNFPQKGAHSNSTEFYRMELESCNLDTGLCPTQSFETSYNKKSCPYFPFRQRCEEDDTDFLMIFNLERQSSNAFFADPVNSANESITLTGGPQAQGIGDPVNKTGGDVYYFLNAENDQTDDEAHKNHTAPILAVVSDTFWLFSTKERPLYEIGMTWNECLAKNFPQVLQRLVTGARSI
jgi:hypothetical protein